MKNKIPQFPKKLPGSFWGITTFFNPARYKNKYENYKLFRENSKRQGLNLLTVELAFGDKPFELKKEDAEILIQIRGNENNIMWQKEALLNIGLKNLPKNCDKIAWLDCDIIFKNDHWISETSKLLKKYKIVQAFETVFILEKNQTKPDSKAKEGFYDGQISKSTAKTVELILKKNYMLNSIPRSRPGFAWTARREIFDKVGFYDRTPISNADTLMVCAFYNKLYGTQRHLSEKMFDDYKKWFEKINAEVKESISYTPGKILHLWHGKRADRMYHIIQEIIKKDNFDPEKDIGRDKNGLLRWMKNKSRMHKKIEDYFKLRNEEGKSLRKINLSWINQNNILKKKKIYFSKLQESYLRSVGLAGKKLKSLSPEIYKSLKPYFPNKNLKDATANRKIIEEVCKYNEDDLINTKTKITIFSVPRAFIGDTKKRQENALKSWLSLKPTPEIILFGDEHGIKEISKKYSLINIENIKKNKLGTPLLDNIFKKTKEIASNKIICYVNSDIILNNRLIKAIDYITKNNKKFLITGRRINVNYESEINLAEKEGINKILSIASSNGIIANEYFIDFFVFPKNINIQMPPFAVGRPHWDNWMLNYFKKKRIATIDTSPYFCAIHQNHDYNHIKFKSGPNWEGLEADHNLKLSGFEKRYEEKSKANLNATDLILSKDLKLLKRKIK